MYHLGPLYRLWSVAQWIINIKSSEDSKATIKGYSEIGIILAPRLGASNLFYYDDADNRDWICRTSEIMTKPYGKSLSTLLSSNLQF